MIKTKKKAKKKTGRIDKLIAYAMETTENRKTGKISVSNAAQDSCSDSCPYKSGGGCYAEYGPQRHWTSKLNEQQKEIGASPEEIAKAEASAISELTGKLDLRVHVVGDARTDEAARILSDAMRAHRAKSGKRAWSYTHGWREVASESWQSESVLASCETMDHVKQAHKKGWASALVVEKYKQTTIYDLGDGFKGIPCPATVRDDKQCVTCGICMNADALHDKKIVVLFEPHGSGKKKVVRVLQTLNLKPKKELANV